MTRKEYNGWTNYETWVVKLWMDNDEGSNSYWNEMAEEYLKRDAESAFSDLAGLLKEQHEEALPEVNGFIADLLNAAMSEVNWDEIADGLIDDAKEALA